MDNKTTFGLKLEQLAELFLISAGNANSEEVIFDDKIISDLLSEQLTSVLPKDSYLLNSLFMMMGRLGCDMRALVGKSLGEVLLNPGSNIGLLQAIKDYSKRLSYGFVSETETTVASSIYYATLASSLIYHDKKITQYSYKNLDQSFTVLAKKKWMPPELVSLFSRARKICKDKENDQ